ncbi:MAG: DUF4215 domain-containing protein [Deltaproteobacteria bacterium]|nr:DUF4215 domain-containing protein [Deltaproteobacteria bacterium]
MNMGGVGGAVDLLAGGDIQLDASTLGATSQVSIHGGDGPEWTEGGEAGELWVEADGDIVVSGLSRISAYGALPYGRGGGVYMYARRDLYFHGVIDAVGAPVLGGGGNVVLYATRHAELATGSRIDLSGAETDGDGGDLYVTAGQEAVIDGAVENRGSYFKSDSDVEVSACSVHVGPNADLDLRALGGDNRLAGGDSLVIDAGARLSSAFGVNELLYRDAAYPPMVAGWLSPAATLTAKPSLPTCRCAGVPPGEQGECDAVCGDAILASTESCDDGNAVSGDGCDSNCTVTACGNGIITSGEQCDDGNNAQGDGCDSACQLDCPPTPSLTCHAPTRAGASILRVADIAGTARDSIKWRLRGADSTTLASFGDPLASTGYVLCLYGSADAVSSTVLQATVPSSAECGAPDCWQRRGLSGYRYRSAASGRIEVSLSARTGGLGDIAVTTKGAAAFVPALPLPQDPSVTVHLRSSQGQCWGATFSAPAARNNALLFKDSSD